MTNEQLDALFRKVFDDVEIGDEQILASATGDAISQEQTILSNLKTELKNLGDVPECQLSTERLRDAILSRGAMPDRVSPLRNWWKFAVPVAASVALGAFLMLNPNSVDSVTKDPSRTLAQKTESVNETNLEPTIEQTTMDESTDEAGVDLNNIAGQEEVTQVVPETTVQPAKKQTSPKRSTKSAPRYAALNSVPSGGSALSGTVSSAALSAEVAPKSSVVSGMAAGAIEGFRNRDNEPAPAADSMKAKDSDSTVVIIGAGADPQTRANPATEADKKNVVFGG